MTNIISKIFRPFTKPTKLTVKITPLINGEPFTKLAIKKTETIKITLITEPSR